MPQKILRPGEAGDIYKVILGEQVASPPDHPRALKPLRNAHPNRGLTRCFQASPPFPRVAKLVAGTTKFRGFTAFGLGLGGEVLSLTRSHLAGYILL